MANNEIWLTMRNVIFHIQPPFQAVVRAYWSKFGKCLLQVPLAAAIRQLTTDYSLGPGVDFLLEARERPTTKTLLIGVNVFWESTRDYNEVVTHPAITQWKSKLYVGNSSVVKIYIINTNRDKLRKMQLQGLPAGNRTRVLWITRPVLYHWATEAVADNLGASSVYIYILMRW